MSETVVRLLAFLIVIVLLNIWEFLSPRINRNHSRKKRLPSNYLLAGGNILFLQLIFPVLPVALALFAKDNNLGLLNYFDISRGLSILISLLVLDLVIYLQHVMFHAIPLFWRFHMMHHTDLDLDHSSGLRFHPVEHVFSMLIKLASVLLIGPPVIAVIIFEIILNVLAMFNHSNIYIPIKLDKLIRALIVTPDMHRVHHSVKIRETNSNFGFNLSWWDRIFGTYKYAPDSGHNHIRIGHALHREEDVLNIWKLPFHPFQASRGNYLFIK